MLAAEAELSLAQGELKLYTVTAPIDGEIAWLDVSPGTVTWPGSLIWGEIVDLRELDIRCELSPAQAEQVAVGQSAEVRLDGKAEAAATGKVVFVGKVADRNSGLVPVVVRVANSQDRLRAEVAVKVRFQTETGEMIAGGSVGDHASHHRGLAGRPGPGRPGPDHPDTGRPGPAGARGTRRRGAGGGIRLRGRRGPLVRSGGARELSAAGPQPPQVRPATGRVRVGEWLDRPDGRRPYAPVRPPPGRP